MRCLAGQHAELCWCCHAQRALTCGGVQVDAGIDKDLVFGDPKAPRFVWWDRKLRPTPSGPDVLTFDLLSIWGKIRAGLGAAGLFKQPLPGFLPPSAAQQHRTALTDAHGLCIFGVTVTSPVPGMSACR